MLQNRILIIDDDEDVRLILRAVFEHAGYIVECVATGSEGIVSSLTKPPALAIVDVALPDAVDGWQICTALKSTAATAPTKIVVVTGMMKSENFVKALELGVDQYLEKPIQPLQLLEVVERLIGPAVSCRAG